ncbi:MAG TPA: CHAT domain-containing protein [Thermoanaerobaculia bacterium]|nr:CHAT domain-containing protein [Thermoanaerobaculia bacterium]
MESNLARGSVTVPAWGMALLLLSGASLAAQTLDEARALHAQQRLPEAVKAYRAAAEATASTDPATAATARNNACAILNELGDFREALKDCAVAIRIRRLQGDPIRLARTLNNAGLALHHLGELRDAEARFQEALEINRLQNDTQGQVINLSNLGLVAASQGRLNRALDLHGTADRMAMLHTNEPWAAAQARISRIHQGVILEKLGAYREALAIYQGVLQDRSELDPHRLAMLRVNVGAVYRKLGDTASAQAAIRDAMATFEAEGDRAGLADAWLNLGLVHLLDVRQSRAAETAFRRALNLARESRIRPEEIQILFYLGRLFFEEGRLDEAERTFTRCLEAAERSGAAEGRWSALKGLGRVAAARGTPEGDGRALQLLERAMAEIEKVPSSPSRSSLRSQDFAERRPVYVAAVELLARMEAREPGAGHAERALAIVQRAKLRELLDALGGTGRAASALPVEHLREEVGNGVLLEYFLGEKDLFLWVVHSGKVRMADLGPYGPILADAMAVHNALSRSQEPDAARLAHLSKILLGPAGKIGSVDLWIAPDGSLRYLPFELLQDTGGKLLVERASTSYLPIGSVLGWPSYLRRLTPVFTLIGFSAPALPADSPAGERAARYGLAPRTEKPGALEILADHLPGRHELFTGPGASEEELRQYAANGTRIVHLAGPTVIDERPGRGAAILLAPSDAEDGLLYPEDINAVQYRADLTVLAGCRIFVPAGAEEGDALGTLSGAFLAAGSPGVIATLWNVGDEANAAFVEQLYRELGKGRRPAEALSRTKRRFREDRRWPQPHVWAAYVLVGDAPRVAYTDHLRYLLGALLLAALALTPVYLDRRHNRRQRRQTSHGTTLEASR